MMVMVMALVVVVVVVKMKINVKTCGSQLVGVHLTSEPFD